MVIWARDYRARRKLALLCTTRPPAKATVYLPRTNPGRAYVPPPALYLLTCGGGCPRVVEQAPVQVLIAVHNALQREGRRSAGGGVRGGEHAAARVHTCAWSTARATSTGALTLPWMPGHNTHPHARLHLRLHLHLHLHRYLQLLLHLHPARTQGPHPVLIGGDAVVQYRQVEGARNLRPSKSAKGWRSGRSETECSRESTLPAICLLHATSAM